MRIPDDFETYVKRGIIRKSSTNRPRAKFLISESQKTFNGLVKRLDVMGIDEDSANSIVKDCYDVLMELIRARLLLDGYNSSGAFAHEAEVSYLNKLDFKDKDILFLNDMRYFRNSVTYYGKILTVDYAGKVAEFTKKIYPKLKERCRDPI
ncbi:hypothetical protein GF336_02215 [Candidatus Woesearchaeota archaeon]|nr:hypothetical protein [Candidatus Woesearchaeota archaeon]